MCMDELNCNRALADAGCNAFNGPMPNVAHRKDSRNAGFQKERLALQRPAVRALSLPEKVRPGKDKSVGVPLEETLEPFGARRGADEDEQRSGRHPFDRARAGAGYRDRLQPIFAVYRNHLRATLDANI